MSGLSIYTQFPNKNILLAILLIFNEMIFLDIPINPFIFIFLQAFPNLVHYATFLFCNLKKFISNAFKMQFTTVFFINSSCLLLTLHILRIIPSVSSLLDTFTAISLDILYLKSLSFVLSLPSRTYLFHSRFWIMLSISAI